MITDLTLRGDATRKRILLYLEFRSRNKMLPPTIREIGENVGLSSSSTVHSHLKQLERQGKIYRIRLTSRSIRIARNAAEICPCCDGSGWRQPILKQLMPGTELIGDDRSPEESSFGH